MKTMILAAGFGTRMRPLTLKKPKILLEVAGKPLIHYQLEKLAKAGMRDVVINCSWLGDQIESALGNGDAWGLNICYSHEKEPLESGGGIKKALPLLGEAPFLLINGDVFSEISFERLSRVKFAHDFKAHLVLVDNPEHNRSGDFILYNNSIVQVLDETTINDFNTINKKRLTFSGISIISPKLFSNETRTSFPLAPLLRDAANKGQVSGEHVQNYWLDVGTPDRLKKLEERLLSL